MECPDDFQELPVTKERIRSGCPGSYKCAFAVTIMVILLGTLCAYIISVTLAHPVLPEDPTENELPTYDFPFVTRAQWDARRPTGVQRLQTPVPFVVIHHSYSPAACHSSAQCSQAMRSMQNFHMDDRGWFDIGYNFAVGGNAEAYEGRGWTTLGAHAKSFNTVSIGICLIGDWTRQLPPAEQMKTAQKLIEAGVALGFISPNYKLVGHRQVRATECPGDALFEEIKSWPHFSPFPSSVDDLVNVKEISSVREEMKKNITMVNQTVNMPVLLHKLAK